MQSPLSNIGNTIGSFFNRSTVSSSVFSGQNADNSQQFLSQTRQFIENQNQTQQVLTTIQQQIVGLQNQIQILSKGLENISLLLQGDTAQEQELLKKQQETQRKNLIEKIRTDREEQLERSIENALITPVQKAAQTVQGFFSRIGDALRIMFLGFLGVQALKFLKAYKEGDEKTLNEIKDLVIKNIGYALAAFGAWKVGLPLLSMALKKMVGKLGDIIFGGIRTIFTSAANKIKNILSNILKFKSPPPVTSGKPSGAVTKPPSAPPSTSPPKAPSGSPSTPSTPSTKPPTSTKPPAGSGLLSRAGRGFGRLLGPLTTAFDFGMRKSEGQSDVQAGAGALSGLAGFTAASSATAAAAAPLAAAGPLGPFIYGATVLGSGVLGSLGASRASDYFTGAGEENRMEGQKATLGGNPVIWSKEKNNWIPDPNAPKQAQVTPTQTMTGENVIAPQTKPDNLIPQSQPTESMTGKRMSIEEESKNKKNEEAPLEKMSDGYDIKNMENIPEVDMKKMEGQELKIDIPELNSNISNVFNLSKEMSFDFISPIADKNKITDMIAPLEEPTPNVIVNSIPLPQEKSSSGKSPVSDVPQVSSSNVDNFYVLYSKLNYNVVI